MDFSRNPYDDIKNIKDKNDSIFNGNIIILKRVKSIRQLRNSEKEWARLCYKEAILKGFTIVKDIQCYIASKTKIWIERMGIEYLRKSEEEENKRWYYNLAKDHFAYIGVYRKIIDEIEQYKKELWSMMTEPDTTNTEKIQIVKELHNLSKTDTLLLRDLPFVTRLSKYYDINLINSNSHHPTGSQSFEENKSKEEKEIIEKKVSERLRKLVDESALFTYDQKRKMGIIESTDADEKITDHVMDDMRKQLTRTPKDILDSINNKGYQESVRKIKEIEED